jgi:divalent metal cation (Fe/Co/Zn/Cd) transporter
LFEDAAALLGIVVAFVGVYASHALNLPVVDGAASIVIGLILTCAAFVLAYECRSLLLGESAEPAILRGIEALVARDPAVDRVGNLLTMHLGPEEILLAMEVDFSNRLNAAEVEAAVLRLEAGIQGQHQQVTRIFIKAKSLAPGKREAHTRALE